MNNFRIFLRKKQNYKKNFIKANIIKKKSYTIILNKKEFIYNIINEKKIINNVFLSKKLIKTTHNIYMHSYLPIIQHVVLNKIKKNNLIKIKINYKNFNKSISHKKYKSKLIIYIKHIHIYLNKNINKEININLKNIKLKPLKIKNIEKIYNIKTNEKEKEKKLFKISIKSKSN